MLTFWELLSDTCCTNVSQVCMKNCFGQLGPEIGNNEWGYDGRATFASAPKSTDTSTFCRLLDGFDRSAFDRPTRMVRAHQLYKLEKLVSSEHRYNRSKAAWFSPWRTTTFQKQNLVATDSAFAS